MRVTPTMADNGRASSVASMLRPDVAGAPSGIPLKLGDAVVGWVTTELAETLHRTPVPHLLITPLPLDVLALRSHKRFLLVPQVSITYISSLGGVTTAYTDSGRFWTDQTLTQVEARLDPRRFIRLDHSHLVNLTRIVEPERDETDALVAPDVVGTLVSVGEVGGQEPGSMLDGLKPGWLAGRTVTLVPSCRGVGSCWASESGGERA